MVTMYSGHIDTGSSNRPKEIQTTSSSTLPTSIGIITDLLRVASVHVKVSQPRVADITEMVKVVERIET